MEIEIQCLLITCLIAKVGACNRDQITYRSKISESFENHVLFFIVSIISFGGNQGREYIIYFTHNSMLYIRKISVGMGFDFEVVK